MSDADRLHQLAFPVPTERCPACFVTSKEACQYDAGLGYENARRPSACLCRHDPANAPWPPGFGEAA